MAMDVDTLLIVEPIQPDSAVDSLAGPPALVDIPTSQAPLVTHLSN